MFTEGTYPYTVGGVSTWCDALITGLPDFEWHILPLVANGWIRPSLFDLPENAILHEPIDVWSDVANPARYGRSQFDNPHVVADLLKGLIAWNSNIDRLIETLCWFRENPGPGVSVFQSEQGWNVFQSALEEVLASDPPDAGSPPQFDTNNAMQLYRNIYWIARSAMHPTPEADLLHVTCAGWSAVPALVHHALHKTPLLITEHGVYVRESYLRGAMSSDNDATRFIYTRLARGLSRAVFAKADLLVPVTEMNGEWEEALGVSRLKIRPIYNGVAANKDAPPLPRNATIISIGRLTVLKDIKTMLRVADKVLRQFPNAKFLHYGPVPIGSEKYARECYELHATLGLGDRFRFMGATREPAKVLGEADIFLMTSISEGLPISILEAMAQRRPSVATNVGGVPETVMGSGILAAPGDIHGLAIGVITLLRNYDLAEQLGERAQKRLERNFSEDAFLTSYNSMLHKLTDKPAIAEEAVAS
jgi:glycosyltransferase involved in cell wall biosynthesis